VPWFRKALIRFNTNKQLWPEVSAEVRLLIDTNVVIGRESNHEVPPALQELLKTLNSLKAEVLLHPESIREIQRDKNVERRKVAISKVSTYTLLDSPPTPNEDALFVEAVGKARNKHDKVDNFLIYSVFRNAVDYLVSEDKEIQKKALRLNLSERVLSCEKAANAFKALLPSDKVERPPALNWKSLHNLDLRDPFFDSLKAEYPSFERWFADKSREGRKGWVHLENGHISALLIPKIENEAVPSTPPLPPLRRLKISTFKVQRPGRKIGELFIKLSVKYCLKNGLTEMYLTHYTKSEDSLVGLLSEYGFEKHAKLGTEDLYLKRLLPDGQAKSMQPLEVERCFYPTYYDGVLARKFIVPIQPQYHDRLFTDFQRQTTMDEHLGEFIVEGNTISKAYLSHSQIERISRGDVLLFYRSQDLKKLTAIAVVEEVHFRQRDPFKIQEKVKNRTVYSFGELEEMARKPTLVLLFRWHFYLPNPLTIAKLRQLKALSSAPQTITKISHNSYLRIKKESGLDERYTVS
jgi:predicted nucleic acid-binding protein